MRKSAALYDWTHSHLGNLASSQSASDFYESLPTAEAKERFLQLAELAGGYRADIEEHRLTSTHFDRWGELHDLADPYTEHFPDFESAANAKLRLVSMLGTLVAASELDLDTDVDADEYELRQILSPIPHFWFVKESNAPDGSLLYVDTTDMARVQADIGGSAPSASLIFHALAALASHSEPFGGRFALVKRLESPTAQDDVETFVRLHFAIAGLATHKPHRLSRIPAPLDPSAVRLSMGYAQWRDVLAVLSEYNSRDELLLKYLTIYQVVEALMFRLPIVELESGMGGAMFSLREFRRLYAAVEINESKALQRLFDKLFSIESPGGATLRSILDADWQSATGARTSEVDLCLERLDLKFRCSGFAAQSAANFSSLVYRMRNSIVHNKETEFHLTAETLSSGCVLLLEEFLLPALEKMIFAVVSSNGNSLWYGHREIRLY